MEKRGTDDIWVLGGSLNPTETYWIRDSLGPVQVDKSVIDNDPASYRWIGRIECGSQMRNYYILEADPP